MSKIAIVGVEGSGKTVLMAGLSECYKQISETEPYLMPENQSAFMFMQCIPHKLRVDREWPEQTRIDSLRMMKWTLRCGQEILEEIEIFDYPGELYRIAFGEHTKDEADAVRSELNEFLEHITEADTLVVLLNLADLVDLYDNPRNAETVWITRGIFDFAKKLPHLKHRMLAFTQADRYAEEIKKAGSAKELYAAKLPMMKTLYPDLKVFAVTAVDGMDADGRPRDGYSVAGCYEFMREVLVEECAAIQNSLTQSELAFEKLKAFTSGDPKAFYQLVEDYINAVYETKQKINPLRQLYTDVMEKHAIRASAYYDLREAVRNCILKYKSEDLVNETVWNECLNEFDGCEEIISAFVKYYKLEKSRLNEQKIRENRENRKIIVVLILIIASLVIGYLIDMVFFRPSRNFKAIASQYDSILKAVKFDKKDAPDTVALLTAHGGKEWENAKQNVQIARSLSSDPRKGVLVYKSAVRNLNFAIDNIRKVLSNPASVVVECNINNAHIHNMKYEKISKCGELFELPSYTKTMVAIVVNDSCMELFEIPSTAPNQKVVVNKSFTRIPKNFEVEKIDLGNNVSFDMVYIVPWVFEMGSPYSEEGRRSDEDLHDVAITKGFWIARVETTGAQWFAISKSYDDGTWARPDSQYPVSRVSWFDCLNYIKKLNAIVPGGGFRLPTEAEWEYSCRAGLKSAYSGDLKDLAKYTEDAGYEWNAPDKVGSKKANRWGLHDMHGNLLEWCSDWAGAYEYKYGVLSLNPKGPSTGKERAVRGGCFSWNAESCRSAARHSINPNSKYSNVGFRLVRDLVD